MSTQNVNMISVKLGFFHRLAIRDAPVWGVSVAEAFQRILQNYLRYTSVWSEQVVKRGCGWKTVD